MRNKYTIVNAGTCNYNIQLTSYSSVIITNFENMSQTHETQKCTSTMRKIMLNKIL